MEGSKGRLIAVCGLDCGECDLRKAPTDDEASERIVAWFREMGWSHDCWILQCCVDEKGFEYCCECEAFPCDRLADWAKGNARYTAGLDRLCGMRGKAR